MNIQESPVAIVTGAGSGIGRATCELLAREGFRLTLVGRDEASLRGTLALISKVDALVAPADVSVRDQAIGVVDQTLKRWGRVDALVNNAAIPVVQAIDQIDQASLEKCFATNAFGPAYLIARCWPTFVAQRSGRIVNVSSISTIDPFPGLAAYAASKAALESFTRSICNEGGQNGIRAFSVVLGAVETKMLRQVVSEEVLPRDRTLDPMDAAKVIADCVLGKRDEESGQAIVVQQS